MAILRDPTELGECYHLTERSMMIQRQSMADAVHSWHVKHGPVRAIIFLTEDTQHLLAWARETWAGVHDVRIHERARGPYVFIKERTP